MGIAEDFPQIVCVMPEEENRRFPAQGRSGEALLRKRQQQAHRRRLAYHSDISDLGRSWSAS
ncbi:hypothetical protein [Pseudomonas serbica]|jgi:hypothetical protein|uniref:hypothetical protein n=1 Tax=Pseudomonas serbica TaxID=2965074 RepID=UPI00237B0027|nr:hypothetical protein [Pseudomonas serbica]